MYLTPSQRQILTILADAQFHSGTELAEQLGISRSAICKQLKFLNDELGIEFQAITGKGYCLEYPLQLLSKKHITQHLNSTVSSLISELEILDVIDSTNHYLSGKIQLETCQGGTVCFAEYQTAGKGRRGREWVSPFGNNIYLSIAWRYDHGPASISGLSLAIGVALIRALMEFGIDDVGLKWPNDIYWQEKKLAGILIEVSGESNGPCTAVIGLGLNLLLPAKKAVSIVQDWVDLNHIVDDITGKRNQLSALLLNHLIPTITGFEEDQLNSYLNEWRLYDCMQGKEVNIYMGKQGFKGVVEGVDSNGMLLLTDDQGELKTFASGEVSFRES